MLYEVAVGGRRPTGFACSSGGAAIEARRSDTQGPRVQTLLPIARWLTLFTDRIVLALELAGLRAAEVTLALKVIDMGGGITPYEPIARAGHAGGRIMACGLGESWRPR